MKRSKVKTESSEITRLDRAESKRGKKFNKHRIGKDITGSLFWKVLKSKGG